MILYLDTPAFIKLYVNEPGADIIRAAVAEADQVHAHWITYPEMRSALARLHRTGRQSIELFDRCKREFEKDWDLVSAIMLDERVLRRAGELAERHGMRGAQIAVPIAYHEHPSIHHIKSDRLLAYDN